MSSVQRLVSLVLLCYHSVHRFRRESVWHRGIRNTGSPEQFPDGYLGQAPDCTGGHLVLLGGRSADFKVLLTNTVYPVRPGPAPPKPKFRLKGKSSPGFEIRTVAAALRCWSLGRPSVARLSPGGECLDISDFKADILGF